MSEKVVFRALVDDVLVGEVVRSAEGRWSVLFGQGSLVGARRLTIEEDVQQGDEGKDA